MEKARWRYSSVGGVVIALVVGNAWTQEIRNWAGVRTRHSVCCFSKDSQGWTYFFSFRFPLSNFRNASLAFFYSVSQCISLFTHFTAYSIISVTSLDFRH